MTGRYAYGMSAPANASIPCTAIPIGLCLLPSALMDRSWPVSKTMHEVSGTTVRQVDTRYDEATGLPTTTRKSLDADTIAVTTRSYDGATGNLLSVTQPTRQTAAGGSGASTRFEYDLYGLFV